MNRAAILNDKVRFAAGATAPLIIAILPPERLVQRYSVAVNNPSAEAMTIELDNGEFFGTSETAVWAQLATFSVPANTVGVVTVEGFLIGGAGSRYLQSSGTTN